MFHLLVEAFVSLDTACDSNHGIVPPLQKGQLLLFYIADFHHLVQLPFLLYFYKHLNETFLEYICFLKLTSLYYLYKRGNNCQIRLCHLHVDSLFG